MRDAAVAAWHRWSIPAVGALLGTLGLIAIMRMETSVADYDPQYMRVLVQRTLRFGGSYYENGIHNKGPFEPFVYEIAERLGGADGTWLVLAVFALTAALAVGAAVAAACRTCGAAAPVAWSMGIAVVVHLTLSESDYAGVLYSRNISVGLLAVAVATALFRHAWTSPRRRLVAVVVVGVVVGLAVQTIVTAAFTAGPVLAWAMWHRRDERVAGRPAWLALPAVAAITFVAWPIYYAVFGAWDDFVRGWWTYARLMSSGTGRSLGSQLGLGWDSFVDYYGQRPELIVPGVLFVAVSAARWRGLGSADRGVRLLTAAWWVGAWIELVLSQRYSSHYFSVLAVPTALQLAVLAADVSRSLELHRVAALRLVVLPLVAAFITIQIGGTAPFWQGVRTASAFDGVEWIGDRRDAGLDARTRMVRATLGLVSEPRDPVLMWTSYPWPYLQLDRVPATRFIWKSFLLGEIYLGRSGPEYVLPGTWDDFRSDLERTDPTAFYVERVNPVTPGTPFDEAVERFTPVIADEIGMLALRDDLADELLSPPGDSAPVAAARRSTTLSPDEPLVLDPDGCVRIDMVLRPPHGTGGEIHVGAGAKQPSLSVSVDGQGGVTVASRTPGRATFTRTAPVPVTGHVELTIVAGARAAAVVIGDEVMGAVELDGPSPVVLTTDDAGLRVADVARAAPISGSGCD